MNPLITDSVYLRVDNRKQFFFDDLLLEQTQNLTRRFHSPQPTGDRPVLGKDRPWEHVLYFTCNTWNVIRDPKDGLFKCWYEDWQIDDLSRAISWIRPSDRKLCLNLHRSWSSRVLYAQSVDGIAWEKPALGMVTEKGRSTNVVLGGREPVGPAHCAYVLLDTLETDPSRRYKAIFENRASQEADDQGGGTFRSAFSSDGIHWKVHSEPVRYGQCGPVAGDVVTVSIDPESGIYRLNGRHPTMCSNVVQDMRNPTDGGWIAPSYPHQFGQENRRRIFRVESSDMIHWSTPTPLVVPEHDTDNIDDEFYGMEQFQIGDDWLGLLNVLHNTDNTMDVQLTYSRNGKDFKRIRPGQPWLAPGAEGSWYPYMCHRVQQADRGGGRPVRVPRRRQCPSRLVDGGTPRGAGGCRERQSGRSELRPGSGQNEAGPVRLAGRRPGPHRDSGDPAHLSNRRQPGRQPEMPPRRPAAGGHRRRTRERPSGIRAPKLPDRRSRRRPLPTDLARSIQGSLG